MKNLACFAVSVLAFFVAAGYSQAAKDSLSGEHRVALDRYLKSHPTLSFRSQNVLDSEYLKYMVESFGSGFMPNYSKADFNRDRRADFAVLLNRKGKAIWQKDITSKQHNPERPLTLVVFNGLGKGEFRVAFVKQLVGPPASFINFDQISKRLYYGIFETDSDTFSLIPRGQTYRLKDESY